jgi:hypothetical protein
MKNLLLSSFIALLISGCKLGHYGRLTDYNSHSYSEFFKIPKPIFGENFNSFLFKTNIRVYGKDFSGLLVTKQMQPNDYRVIFTTELGMKLFDFEFKDTAFTLHYCVPQFNRPALLKTIQKDIELLLMTKLTTDGQSFLIDKKREYAVFKSKDEKYCNYYFTEIKTKNIVKIEHSKRNRVKTTLSLNNYSDNVPGSILIKHHDIKLKIELNLLKK